MALGSYHQNICRDERRTHEVLTVRDGRVRSTLSAGPVLTNSLGDAFTRALKK
jgi:hypothetical protein